MLRIYDAHCHLPALESYNSCTGRLGNPPGVKFEDGYQHEGERTDAEPVSN